MGILYLGPPNCTVQSTPWFFQYVQTITQQYVSFDASQYPLTVQANPGSLLSECIEVDNTEWGSGPLASNPTEYVVVAGGPTSYSCTGILAPNATLVNGWTVAGAPVLYQGASQVWITQAPAVGGTSLATSFAYSYGVLSSASAYISIPVQGEAGTSPTCQSLGASGICQDP
jgi:hypothetical protein